MIVVSNVSTDWHWVVAVIDSWTISTEALDVNGIDGEARDSPEGGDEPDAVDAGQEDGQDDEAGRLPADAAAAVRVVVGADDAQVGRHGRQRRQHHEAHGVADQVVGVARRVRVHQPLPQRQPKKTFDQFWDRAIGQGKIGNGFKRPRDKRFNIRTLGQRVSLQS